MRQVQQLSVVGRLFPSIVDCSKSSTIRWNENPITPGVMRYVREDPPHRSIDVMVIACTQMPLSQASEFLGREVEWPSEVMLDGMREHYPEISLSDIIVVIEHLTPQQTRLVVDDPGDPQTSMRS